MVSYKGKRKKKQKWEKTFFYFLYFVFCLNWNIYCTLIDYCFFFLLVCNVARMDIKWEEWWYDWMDETFWTCLMMMCVCVCDTLWRCMKQIFLSLFFHFFEYEWESCAAGVIKYEWIKLAFFGWIQYSRNWYV